MGVAEGGQARLCIASPLVGCVRGGALAPAAAMNWGRLSRLLKPALLCGALAAPGLAGTMCASRDDWRCARSMHEFSAKDIDGHMICLDKYRGFVCIVTNVASQ